MKNLFILMFVVSFFSVSSVFAEGESLTNADGSFCEEGGKSPSSISSVREESDSSSGSVQE